MEQQNFQPEQTSFDVSVHKEQLRGFKNLSKKYGWAFVMLTLNNFISSIFFVLIAAFIGGLTGINLLNSETEPGYCATIILNELAAYVFPIIILFFMFKKERSEFIPDRTYKPFPLEAVMMYLAGMACGALGSLITININSVIDSIFGTGEIEEAFAGLTPSTPTEFGVFAFCICIVAPVAEEFIFRDFLLKPLRAYGDTTAAVITGLAFGLYHGNFDQFAYAAMVGFFYSVIAIKYNSCLPTILLHCLNNALVTFADLSEAVTAESEAVQAVCKVISDACSTASGIMIFAGAPVFIFLFCIKAFSLNNHNRYVPEPHSLIDFITVPSVILGTVAMLAVFFI